MNNSKSKLTKNINLGELIANYPKAARSLVEDYNLHCVGCFAASFETLEQGLQVHGHSAKDIDKIIKKLQTLEEESNKSTKDKKSKK
jgi:hybrid cluster-associated redox disulfide protein